MNIIRRLITDFFTLKANKPKWYHVVVTGERIPNKVLTSLPLFKITSYVDGEMVNKTSNYNHNITVDLSMVGWFK